MNSTHPTKSKSRRSKKQTGGNKAAVSKYAGDAYSLAVRTYNGLNAVRKLINIEFKDFNLNAGIQTTSTFTVINLSPMSQGLQDGQRVGNSIKLQHLYFGAYILLYPGVTVDQAMRVTIVRDNENAGTAPTAAQLFQNTAAFYQLTSPLLSVAERRFAVLYDESFNLAQAGDRSAFIKYSFAHNGHIKYRSTDATDASAAEGTIWLFLCSDNGTGSQPAIYYNWRIRYTDD